MNPTSTKQKIYPWLIVVAWSFMACATMEFVVKAQAQYFKPISDAIGSPISTIALMMTVITMTISVCAPIAGRLYPKYDSRIVLTVMGVCVFGAYAAMSFFSQVWMWWIAAFFIGAGVAGVGIIGAPIFITNWFAKRTGFALGMYGIILAALSFILQPMIAVVIRELGYQNAYLAWAGICAVMYFPFALFVVKFKPEQIGLKPFGYVEGETEAKDKAEATGPGVPFKKATPTLAFICLLIATGIMCNHGGWMSNFSNIAQTGWGYDIVFGGLMMSFYTAAQFTNPLVGWVMDKLGAVKTSVITLALVCLGFALLWLAHSVEAAVFFGVFCVGFSSVNMKIVIPMLVRDIFGPKDHSKIYSFLYGIINFLGAWATSLVALIGEVTGSFDIVMIVGLVVTAISLGFVLLASAASKKLVWED
jgi:MFS family permease